MDLDCMFDSSISRIWSAPYFCNYSP